MAVAASAGFPRSDMKALVKQTAERGLTLTEVP
jgi:hypothetical protein